MLLEYRAFLDNAKVSSSENIVTALTNTTKSYEGCVIHTLNNGILTHFTAINCPWDKLSRGIQTGSHQWAIDLDKKELVRIKHGSYSPEKIFSHNLFFKSDCTTKRYIFVGTITDIIREFENNNYKQRRALIGICPTQRHMLERTILETQFPTNEDLRTLKQLDINSFRQIFPEDPNCMWE
jgi:hypothetical protein